MMPTAEVLPLPEFAEPIRTLLHDNSKPNCVMPQSRPFIAIVNHSIKALCRTIFVRLSSVSLPSQNLKQTVNCFHKQERTVLSRWKYQKYHVDFHCLNEVCDVTV